VGLVQLIRFLVVELNHLDLNSRFDMSVVFTANYTFSGRQCSCRQQCTFGDRLHESQDQNWLSLSEVLIGVGCVCVQKGECCVSQKKLFGDQISPHLL
jgi:hypothetical protein